MNKIICLCLLLLGFTGVDYPHSSKSEDIFLSEVETELAGILHYWQSRSVDEKYGGFVGEIDAQNQVNEKASKCIILNTRILWTFSAAYNYTKKEEYLKLAHRAFQYLSQHFIDAEFGGVYWSVDYEGKVKETDKQIYAQSFAIYALSEYYLATQNPIAKAEAVKIFELIEKYSFDSEKGGYRESFERNWQMSEKIARLGKTPEIQRKNMNTHLHLMEAYTALYKIYPDKRLGKQLVHLVNLFQTKFLDKKSGHFWGFFDDNWQLQSKVYSYGHDIEAAWLLTRAIEVSDNQALSPKINKLAIRIADVTLKEGLDKDGGIFDTGQAYKVLGTDKHWWPQAEAMVGFVDAYQITQKELYLQKAKEVWQFIKKSIIDSENGEWFGKANQNGEPYRKDHKVSAWKCPYHNSRALLEVLKRLKND